MCAYVYVFACVHHYTFLNFKIEETVTKRVEYKKCRCWNMDKKGGRITGMHTCVSVMGLKQSTHYIWHLPEIFTEFQKQLFDSIDTQVK